MRVLTVSHYYSNHLGGIEIVAREVVNRLARAGMDVTWAASEPADPDADPGVRCLPMKTWNFSERFLDIPYPLWSTGSLFRLVRAVRKCDVVHIHDCVYLGSLVTFFTARVFGIPIVITQHIDFVPVPNRLVRALNWLSNRTITHWMMKQSGAVVFCSEKIEQYFCRFVRFNGRHHFIAKGVAPEFHPVDETERRNLRRELGLPETGRVLLFVGRFAAKKGLNHLRQLAPRFPDCRWIFVGWGKDDPARWNLSNVTSVGAHAHPELAKYYRAADLLVLPSVGEGFPLVVQEAMACGTPALISAETARPIANIEKYCYVSDLDLSSLEATLRHALAPGEGLRKRSQVADFARAQEDWNWDLSARRHHDLYLSLAPAISALLGRTSETA